MFKNKKNVLTNKLFLIKDLKFNMKDIVSKIYESAASDYLFCYAVMCDKETSDWVLATIDADAVSNSIVRKIQNLVVTDKVDKVMVCWRNDAKQTYKEITQGVIIDRDGQIFICIGNSDGVDKDELERLYKNKDWAKKQMKDNGYVVTSSEKGKTRMEIDIKDVKKLKTSMVE